MEIILAIVVAIAVIFFGALISMGNERQRRAIDQLREQMMPWALQDLSIKRETLAQNVKFENPQTWLNQVASRVCGYEFHMEIVDTYEEPQAIFCTLDDGAEKIVFSPLSPSDIHRLKKNKRHRLRRFIGESPLFSLPNDVRIYELSMLNAGTFFDLEVDHIWSEITGRKLQSTDRLWMYQYS